MAHKVKRNPIFKKRAIKILVNNFKKCVCELVRIAAIKRLERLV